MSSKVYPCEMILYSREKTYKMPITLVELIQEKSKELHSRKYQISIGHVDMGRCVCHELTTHKNKTNKKRVATVFRQY